MPKRVSPLSDPSVKNARTVEKDYKLADGCGTYLLVAVSGGKLWRLDYRHEEKRKTLALGAYPNVSLSEARNRRDQARQLIANGVDPGDMKKQLKVEKAEKAANTFEKLAREWHKRQAGDLSERTRTMIMLRLERDAFPAIGNRPLDSLKAQDIRWMTVTANRDQPLL